MTRMARGTGKDVRRRAAVIGTVLAASVAGVLATGGGSGSVSLGALNTPYTQNFDTLASSGSANALTITGWFLNEAGTSANNNGQYQGGTGSGTGGDVYSFGSAATPADRAFGTLFSGTLNPTLGAQFTNNTGSTVTSLDIAYVGEMWRAGVANRGAADRLDFQLSTDATSLTDGTWVDANALDFSSPNVAAAAGALDGNASANRTAVSATLTGLSIPNGSTFWIRWIDSDIMPALTMAWRWTTSA